MMKTKIKQYIPFLALVFIGVSVGAYTAPTGTPPSGNTAGPFTIGDVFDTKNSGLSLGGSFTADGTTSGGSALFAQDLAVKTQINGGRTNNTTSTISIGSTTTPTDLAVTGAVTTGTIRADSLLPQQSGAYQTVVDSNSRVVLRKVCTNPQGSVVLCPTETGGVCGDGVVNTGEDCDEKGATASCTAICTWNTGRANAWSTTSTKNCYTGGVYQCSATENCIANTCRAWMP